MQVDRIDVDHRLVTDLVDDAERVVGVRCNERQIVVDLLGGRRGRLVLERFGRYVDHRARPERLVRSRRIGGLTRRVRGVRLLDRLDRLGRLDRFLGVEVGRVVEIFAVCRPVERGRIDVESINGSERFGCVAQVVEFGVERHGTGRHGDRGQRVRIGDRCRVGEVPDRGPREIGRQVGEIGYGSGVLGRVGFAGGAGQHRTHVVAKGHARNGTDRARRPNGGCPRATPGACGRMLGHRSGHPPNITSTIRRVDRPRSVLGRKEQPWATR